MLVTSDEQRSGLLVAIISGGRPRLYERPTEKFLQDLNPLGVHDVVWVVSESDAAEYEHDGRPLATYSREWAFEYASKHWMHPTPPARDGFFGAFPGREWACLEAERRGCWGVLQLDDNIVDLRMPRGAGSCIRWAEREGGLGLFADMLAAVALSTNARMVGANLNSVAVATPVVARKGFPYSLFIERMGEGREHWFGPFEDDITHAFQYGTRADGATAALMPALRYMKESQSTSGMRAKYNHERSVQLQRIFPESANVVLKSQKSNGRGGPRIFHQMSPNAIRNKLIVTDPELMSRAKERMEQIITGWWEFHQTHTRNKVEKRVARSAR